MTVKLARIDQRLIHGIIVNQWAKTLNITRFMVIDDEISQNEEVKAGMRLAKPRGTGMSIINTKTAIENFSIGKYDNQEVLILVKEPSVILRLIKGGVSIKLLNLGIIFNNDNREPITKFVALNNEERSDLTKIQNSGTRIKIQYLPDSANIPYKGELTE
ncbi:PTS sugar transporter subunit IIB [Dellaglioa algida]|uniref:PTS sugar transporter subunit IIB n=1 Tax=Dellaglioa algida TaxID=105612 RepID=UPI0024C4CB1E|nr:PTS sugar transporter subunit IIB [Dellaglioa algida]MDK1727923.1 PTS sugar transporter subunit IIB [Dellaglioa algida]MDK1735680.1 PTS sugar transporter subunit IIB [Dellaglioa algida]MDK1737254.1 PTS sugar transporter subunit IIB [Dellaglioa algida]